MAKGGKLIVLLDVPPDEAGLRAEDGLGKLLGQHNVRVGSDRILRLPSNLGTNPVQVFTAMNPDPALRERNLVVAAFAKEVFPLYGVRTVQAGHAAPGGKYIVDTLLFAPFEQGIWKEADLAGDPYQIGKNLLVSNKYKERISKEDLPVAVVVSEGVPPAGNDPHAMMEAPQQKPRLVVFGSATWSSNRCMAEGTSGAPYYALFSSCLAWLRERPSDIGIEPKKSDIFVLKPNTELLRMILLPAIVLFVGVIGMGVGVWVVRRR